MKTKTVRFQEGEYFHIYNRGVEKRRIFLDDSDRWRFLALLLLFQGRQVIPQISRIIPLVRHSMFDNEFFAKTVKQKEIELVAFCLMDNHFHLLLGEKKEGGISKYMQRLSNAYTKYFNTRYKRSGHLFAGKFKSSHIDRNDYMTYLSAYIHLNPRELRRWAGHEIQYFWSSFQDFSGANRWGALLDRGVVLDQFKNGAAYQDFVETTPAKRVWEKVGDAIAER